VVAGGFRLIGNPPKSTSCQRHSCGRKSAFLPQAFLRSFWFVPTIRDKENEQQYGKHKLTMIAQPNYLSTVNKNIPNICGHTVGTVGIEMTE
jgi:hypothetical protein